MTVSAHRLVETEPNLAAVFEGADHVDVTTIDGDVSLRTFLAGMASYSPVWMQLLYAVRWVFVRLLGLSQDGLPSPTPIAPDEVPFDSGGSLAFFTVTRATAGRYWVGRASEDHLTATLAVVVDDGPQGRRFHVVTAVRYHRRVGRLYFAVVRPFHYLVVDRMAAAGVSPERRVGQAVVNVHERRLDAPASHVGELVDSLGSDADALWPATDWPPLRLDGPLAVGVRGGHGPVRYEVEGYDPGASVRFRFTEPATFDGVHRFEVVSTPAEGTWLRHVIRMRISGSARLTWPLADRHLHDALLEDALDRAARAVGDDPPERRWPRRVRLLVWLHRRL